MKRSAVLLLAVLAAATGCSRRHGASGTDRNAAEVAAHPFSIGTSYANEMGAAPRGEMDDGIVDPYVRMARDAAAARPVPDDPANGARPSAPRAPTRP